MIWDLPERLEVGGVGYDIRWGYRAALDLCAALADPELDGQEKTLAALCIFYPRYQEIPPEQLDEAMEKLCWFLRCGQDRESEKKSPRLVDWERDFPLIAAPVNRVLGTEIRKKTGPEDDGIHWWTFVSAYQEIGDCLFAQVVRIRDRLARGKALDKSDREWYRRNRDLVDLKTRYTGAERELLRQWGGG